MIRSFIHSFIHSLIRAFITYLFSYLPSYLIHSSIHSFIHSVSQSALTSQLAADRTSVGSLRLIRDFQLDFFLGRRFSIICTETGPSVSRVACSAHLMSSSAERRPSISNDVSFGRAVTIALLPNLILQCPLQ